MKNLLSENMLRFGTKNLSEAAKKELTLKSILETIDHYDLRKEIIRALNEININGYEWKYPFKDENQLQEYFRLMTLNLNSGTKFGIDPEALTALHTALLYQTAIEGIKPGTLDASRMGSVAMRFSNLSPNDKTYVQGALRSPKIAQWYTSYWLPLWKKAYLTTFPPQPNDQAPQVPGKF